MKYRSARPDDAAALMAVRASALHALGDPYSPEQVAAWRDAAAEDELRDAICRDRRTAFSAFAGGADGGCIGFVRLGFGASVHLLALYVDPRWQRRGVGAALLRVAHAVCRARRVARLHVAASLNAVSFYAERGYVGDDRFSWCPAGAEGGPDIPAVRMTLLL